MSRRRVRRKAFREAYMAHAHTENYQAPEPPEGPGSKIIALPPPISLPAPTASTAAQPTTRPKPIYGQTIEQNVLGYHFRSKTEAQWAFFLEYLGIKWLFEPEAYELSRRYLPDFFIPSLRCWLEIKGPMPSEDEKDLCRELSKVTGQTVILNFGEPGWWIDNETVFGGSFQFHPNGGPPIVGMVPAVCPGCKGFLFHDGKTPHLCLEGGVPESEGTLIRQAARYANRGIRWNG
jgi:hypothetical protein